MATELVLKKADHEKIQSLINLGDEEDYSVVTHRIHGEWKRSVHVFKRRPTTRELTEYENKSSKVKFKGAQKAEIEGGAVLASENLYNKLIARVYDLPLGRKVYGELIDATSKGLNAEQAKPIVPPLVKREALRDFVGEVYSESKIAEREGDDEVKEKGDDDEDKEEE